MFRRIEVVYEYRREYFKAGAGGMLGAEMVKLGLKSPAVNKRNTRFFFTEKGWDVFGRKLAAAAAKAGYTVKIRSVKEGGVVDVLYRDEYQVAVRFKNKNRRKNGREKPSFAM